LRGNGEYTDGIGNVLQHRLAQVYELSTNGSSNQLPDIRRNAYTAWFRKALDPYYEVHGMAINVFGLDNDVAETDSHAQIDTMALWYGSIVHHHGLLHVQGATHSVDGTAEFNEGAIARVFDDPTAMFANFRFHDGSSAVQ
jgi:hypothetical protein